MATEDDFVVEAAAVSAYFFIFESSDEEHTVAKTSSQGRRSYVVNLATGRKKFTVCYVCSAA